MYPVRLFRASPKLDESVRPNSLSGGVSCHDVVSRSVSSKEGALCVWQLAPCDSNKDLVLNSDTEVIRVIGNHKLISADWQVNYAD